MSSHRPAARRGQVKCLVWDLDDTLWDGVLLEGDDVRLRPHVAELLTTLDQRGILHSVASRNDEEAALARLRRLGVEDMFVYPQIGWNPKSSAIERIAQSLNIGVDALAFVDDQEFERAEVSRLHPGTLCLAPAQLEAAVDRPEFNPRFVTAESRLRRSMFRSQIAREQKEVAYQGTPEQFLAELGMRFTIRRASQDDLQRAEELTVRTNQLNSTGRTYGYEELDELRGRPDHLLLVADLTDKYGSYGTIGLALVELGTSVWHLRLLLMSCRTMSRGVGTVLLNHVMTQAKEAGVRLRADFVETGRNRQMQITYAFAGFREAGRDGEHLVLESDLQLIQQPAPYLELRVEDLAPEGVDAL
ncbi:HAD-IIIC family phosphatase [Cryptosporangium sp. NPDC051539]|uniref:HAD-IIIC family phosphatase n=1 Tax=Cryptosporangium sp. NPDC051539 TaxID=3363962 RepID=UPI00379519B3